jgi:hypothetical protein
MTAETPVSEAVTLKLDSSARRQLDEDGLIVLWRDGREPGQRVGLVCWLAVCPDPDCKCKDVLVEGFTVDARATAIHWDDDRLRVEGSAAWAPSGAALEPKLFASVDVATGEIRDDPDAPTASESALLGWLAAELDGEVLDAFYRYFTGVKGFFFEEPRAKIDIPEVEAYHLAYVDDLIDGVRPDEYILGGRRYWYSLYLCPRVDCDCRRSEIVFFEEDVPPEAPNPEGAVGSLRLDLSGAEGFKLETMKAEPGVPVHLIRELWASFRKRHDVGVFLRRRQAQCKAVGRTLWRLADEPVRASPQPGRNAPCPCGSGRKYKKCCLTASEPTRNDP